MRAFEYRLSQYVATASSVVDLVQSLEPETLAFHAGSDIVRGGQRATNIFIVLSGWAYRYRSIEDGRRSILNFMLPGDIFDLQALGDLDADHSVAALEDVEVLCFDAQAFLQTLKTSGAVATAFWWSAVQEESILREQIVRIGQLSAAERIGHLILELQRRLNVSLGEDTNALRLPLTRTDIGDALGLTPVHVSRTISGMKRKGLITEDRSSLTILDKEKLAKTSKFDPDYLHINRLDIGAELVELPGMVSG